MKNIKTVFTIFLLLPLLTGCWHMTFHGDKPDEYIKTKNIINTLYGSTREDIIRNIGKPKWTENRSSSTYFIYEWTRTDKDAVFFVLPIPVAGGIYYLELYCLLLEFDEDGHLANHDYVNYSDNDPPHWGVWVECTDVLSKPFWHLTNKEGIYCPDDLGHTDTQMRIAENYQYGISGVDVDLYRAYVWYSLANTTGNRKASRRLNIIEKMLPGVESEAMKLLEQWQPTYCSSELISRRRELIQGE